MILAHKPDQLDAVAREIDARDGIVVSILGGTHASPSSRPPIRTRPSIRVEPNIAGRGAPRRARRSPPPTARGATRVKALFERVGTVVEVPETLIDVAGAVSGVGPAYWALLAEAWTDAAIRHGIPAAQAATLVTETMAGTAALLTQTDTLALRRAVTSPGGSTARGLAALERGGVRAALADAMDDVVGG